MTPDDEAAPPDAPDRVVGALDRLARGLRAHRQAVATRHHLSPLQLELLAVVAAGPPPEPLGGTLARELAVSQPTVTDSLRALVDKGLVARTPDPADRRRTLVSVTPAGAALADQLTAADRTVRDAIGALDPARQGELLDALLDVIARFVDAGVIDVARTCTTCHHHRRRPDGGHHCTLLGTDLTPVELRVNCPEHTPTRPVIGH